MERGSKRCRSTGGGYMQCGETPCEENINSLCASCEGLIEGGVDCGCDGAGPW